MIRVPDYFIDFKCIADRCKHSCCRNWDIYVDSESLEKYRTDMGDCSWLTKSLCEDEDGKRWVHVETSPAAEVYLHVGSKAPVSQKTGGTAFDLPLAPRARYFRVAVYDKDGRVASSRGYFVE